MQTSQFFANHTSDAALNWRRVCHSVIAAAMAVGIFAGAAHAEGTSVAKKPAAVKAAADPLAKDVWHAVGETWPGTLKFTATGKKVELAPLGAQALQATYEVSGLKNKGTVTEGTLRMKDAAGREVNATFTIRDGKNLALRFSGGQREETYARMNPAEEAAELEKLKKMMEQRAKTAPIR